MSLVFSGHVVPARERHGAHYRIVSRKHDGAEVPGMIYKYEGAGDEGWDCRCSRTNWAFAKACPVCGAEKP